MTPGKLVLVRHGLSTYNDQNRFTGWKDVPLNAQGVAEAEQAVPLLRGMEFGIAFTSLLVRAQNTLDIMLAGLGQEDIPVEHDLALNERNYGDLIGQDKAEAAERFGAEQVHQWRRSFDVAPPGGESLADTTDRAIPYLHDHIMPEVRAGRNVLVSAHGNSIRAIVMQLLDYSPAQIMQTEIGWCEPWVFSFGDDGLVVDLQVIPRPGVESMSRLPQ
ncbi:MAG: 2,3-diphosphoglycerate-dependent phosphoglycerate mutase [Candidatus Poseidoniia archaeon]|uniref:2,3-bisphosphoglycerate-dependent phosphoglycerate mutase n=1 Tax=Marine Group III euryarchaeote TaxID=2173149 RepID=A0A7C7ZCT4_9ARCH|nr:MAG: 2,3-bisphosphoglycerate-dependent phosphoglycerate mutase [Euryarchaeota archaeon]HIG63014.1 2,3-diphosphoglycerate-dependent phosphoglycerate mutase [Marine Group III euryarchaeote]HIL33703.1 2,3-diphosphoglycerate-dependent phosphoglycerate mutase [Candidatus Poseidoniales archaeon]